MQMKHEMKEKQWKFTCVASEIHFATFHTPIRYSNSCHTWLRML